MKTNDLKGFCVGKKEFRPAPFWSWNDKLDKTELLSQIEKMKRAGYGGFFMHSRVGLITGYLSDEWMELVKACAENSGDLDAYLYDEDMWPSGYASGAVPAKGDEFREKSLVLVRKGELLPTDEIFAEHVDGGEIFYVAMRVCKSGNMRFGGECYLDALNPDAVKEFLHSTHEKYKQTVGYMFGKQIKGVFTDEPCYGIHWFYTNPRVTYSPSLRQRILDERGYDIKDCCVSLFFDVGDYKRIRYDYFTLAGNQLRDSYTRQYAEWCEKNGLFLTGHLMAEETMYEQAQWTGGVMQNYAYMQRPGIDKLQRINNQLTTLKQLTSVTEQLGKSTALSECFAGIGQDSGFAKRKQIVDWQAINGITFVNPHLSHYSMRGERKRDYPPNIFYQQPYFEYESLFSDYVARISHLASYGKRNVKILIIQPLGNVFAGYNPNDKDNQAKLKIYDQMFSDLSFGLQSKLIDFHYGDEQILSDNGCVQDGKIVVGEYAYDMVILCNSESLRKETLNLLEKFKGSILAIGQQPTLREYREEVSIRVDKIFDDVNSLVNSLTNLSFATAPIGVIGCNRVGKDGDIFIFTNTSENDANMDLSAFYGGFVLELSSGKAYNLTRKDAIIHPNGSLAVFMGNADVLEEWGVETFKLPPISSDGVTFTDYTVRQIDLPECKVLDENALVVDRADFYSDGIALYGVPLHQIWHYVFYKLKEGQPYEMRYTFKVDSIPDGPIQIVAENAENLQEITLNGKLVVPMRRHGEPQRADKKAYKDLSFTRCNTDALKVGENTVVIKGKKYNNVTDVCNHRPVKEKEYYPTEAEPIYVVGDFAVNYVNGEYSIAKREKTFGNIAERGYPFYSGLIECEIDANLNGEMILLDCDCAYACVETDGKKYIAGNRPFVFDLRDNDGKRRLKITLANTLYPLLGPHNLKDYEKHIWIDPGIFNDLSLYQPARLIRPFGLNKINVIKESKHENNNI